MQNNKLSKLFFLFSFFLFYFSFFFIFSSFIFILSSCQRSTEPVLKIKNLHLKLLDVFCTEAWLSLKMEKAAKDSTGLQLQLYRDDSLMVNKPFSLTDSVLYVEGLQPSTSYSFTAKVLKNGQLQATSNRLSVTTMDTTSHDFEWQTFEFGGQGGSSYFKDVAIIDENDIWTVGEIYTADDKYNAAHWDGEKWELRKIKTNACGGVTYPPINTVFAFAKNDIVFGHIDASITKYNGATFVNDCSFIKQINGSINKIWGTSDNDLYVVGNNGLIAHYDGRQWQRIDSGTDLGLTDIWGVSENEIYAVGVHRGQYLGIVLQYDGNIWQKLIDGVTKASGFDMNKLFKTQLYGTTEGVWIDERGTVYTVGNLMYQYKLGKWDFVRSLPENYLGGNTGNYYRGYLYAVRGNRSNDMFIVGEGNTCIHFNGMTWRKLGPEYMPFTLHYWLDLAVTETNTVVVGSSYHDGNRWARVMHLRR